MRRGWFVLIGLVCGVALAAPPEDDEAPGAALRTSSTSATPLARVPDDVANNARAVRELPLGERIKAITDPWLGRPYAIGVLGEADLVDPDPLTRYDVFDCLTFVEEALALALAPDPVSAHRVRVGLRYRGGAPITYENRKHFMLAEWIPQNVAEGWIEDITPNLPGATQATKVVTAETWRRWGRRSLFDLPDERLPVGTLNFWYVPLSRVAEALAVTPDGAIVFEMRVPRDWIPITLTHVSLKVPAPTPTLRHASRTGRGGVRDERVSSYIARLQAYSNWPAAGVVVLMPREFGPHVGRVGATSP
ncbi:DUF1460 domain-containing protein [Myxococcota bacterium]|nr:DUF1460 domain-containing protein [Myxococcota bacterium]